MNLKVHFLSFILFLLCLKSFGYWALPRDCKDLREDDGLELLHVNVVFRHGARSPFADFPTNPNSEYVWNQEGESQLTQVGMRQQYEFGRFLRRRYGDFLSSAYRRQEIFVRSSDTDRTLMGALCSMAGLYIPGRNQMWKRGLSWQPIPVHTIAKADDFALHFPNLNTREYGEVLNQLRNGPAYQRVAAENENFLEELTRLTQFPRPLTIDDSYNIWDPLIAAEAEGLAVPVWYTADRRRRLLSMASFVFASLFGKFTPLSAEILRSNHGVLIKEILQNFGNSINETASYKAFVYSAHDYTLTALLVAYNNYDELPPFGSSIMFELYRDPNRVGERQYIVRTFYRTSPRKRPRQLNLLGCGFDCPLAELTRLSKPFIPVDE